MFHLGWPSESSVRAALNGRFGFGLGTLPGHAAAGEERFLLGIAPSTGVVRYDVQEISGPEVWLARLGRPAMCLVQRRFQRESMEALNRNATNERGTNDG